jgi:exopolysaccharide biosynthesis protein
MVSPRFGSAARHALLVVLAAATTATSGIQPAALEWASVADGVDHTHITRPAPGGRWSVHVLRVDPSRARLDVVRANGRTIGLETVSAIAARHRALAAINGGYFRIGGEFSGDSTGTLQIDGHVLSEPDRGRASVGIIRGGPADRLIFGHVVWRAHVSVAGRTRRIDGVNRARGPDDLVVFTPQFGPAALTDASGIEVVVAGGVVRDVRDRMGGSSIPADGWVVSARGSAASWLRQRARVGATLQVSMGFEPADRSRQNLWRAAEDILGAGPRLVRAGRVEITDIREKMIPRFRRETHPRTAVAVLEDGRAVLLVADGRHPPERVGMSLDDLARLLIDFGARDAINLDGGGSTTMVVNGTVMNRPSDPTGERPVSDAIIVRPRSSPAP